MRITSIAFMAILCGALVSPVSADDGKGKRNDQGGPKAETSANDRGRGSNDRGSSAAAAFREADPVMAIPYPQIVIVDRDRDVVRTYYRTEHAAGRCPPDLAMQKNGCLPPGQAKKAWAIGQPLPTEIVYARVPRAVWRQLTPAPYGHDYVRVADDVVLISTITRVVVGLLGNLQNVGD